MLLVKKLQVNYHKFTTHRVWLWKEKISELLSYRRFDGRFKTSTLIAAFKNFSYLTDTVIFHVTKQCRIQTFSGHTVILKLRIGQFGDTQKHPVVAAEGPKIFNFQCVLEGYFCLLKKFLFLSIYRSYFIQFLRETYNRKSVRTFLAAFFGHSYRSNGTKIHLDVALQNVILIKIFLKYSNEMNTKKTMYNLNTKFFL